MKGTHLGPVGARSSARERDDGEPGERVYRWIRALLGLYLLPALLLVLLVGAVLIALDWLFQRAVHLFRFLAGARRTMARKRRADFAGRALGTRPSPLRDRSDVTARTVCGLWLDTESRN